MSELEDSLSLKIADAKSLLELDETRQCFLSPQAYLNLTRDLKNAEDALAKHKEKPNPALLMRAKQDLNYSVTESTKELSGNARNSNVMNTVDAFLTRLLDFGLQNELRLKTFKEIRDELGVNPRSYTLVSTGLAVDSLKKIEAKLAAQGFKIPENAMKNAVLAGVGATGPHRVLSR